MILFKKLFIFLFFLLCSNFSLIGQIKIEYHLAKTFVVSGEKQSLNIVANNVPEGAQVLLKINDNHYVMKNNQFYLSILEEAQYGYRDLNIELTVKLKGKVIYKENKLIDYDIEPKKITFETSFGNVLYIGIDNHFNYVTNHTGLADLILNLKNVVGYRKENGFNLKVTESKFEKCTISILKKITSDSSIILAEKEFVISKLPEVTFKLNTSIDHINQNDTNISLQTNLVAPFIELLNVKIDSFSCQIFTDNKWLPYRGYGSEIKGNLLEKIKTLKPKDILYFDQIYYSSNQKSDNKTIKTLCLIKS